MCDNERCGKVVIVDKNRMNSIVHTDRTVHRVSEHYCSHRMCLTFFLVDLPHFVSEGMTRIMLAIVIFLFFRLFLSLSDFSLAYSIWDALQ